MNPLPLDKFDARGLICGFVLRPGAAPAPLAAPPDPHARLQEAAADAGASDQSVAGDGALVAPGFVWLHYNLADARARKWLTSCAQLAPAARELLLDEDSHIRIARIGDGLAGVLGDLDHEFNGDPEGLRVFRIYVDDHCVVSGRRQPLRTMDRLRREVMDGLPVDGPAHLLAHLLEDLAETFGREVSKLGDAIDDAEDRTLKDGLTEEPGSLGQMRRLLARLRRHVGAGRTALAHVLPRLPGWCQDADVFRFRHATERLEALGQDIELVQERARLLQEEIAGRLGQATNRNLYVLSIVTTIFLPITLITGIFGMNVGGLPWVEHAAGFWWVVAVMLVMLVLLLLLLRWRRLF